MKKVMFISSTGGHLDELMQLKPLFKKYNYHIVTEKDKMTEKLKKEYGKRISYLVYGTRNKPIRYIFKLSYNTILSLLIYIKYRPGYIITTGAHTAGPMCCIGKLFGSKIIYIETFANINKKTVTGRIIYHFADLFIVQWEEMLELYPKAVLGGSIY